jgi:hypothetical protein
MPASEKPAQLPATRDHNRRRLIAETRKFLRSPWFSAALLNGWSLEALFGVDCGAPLDNYERWGLIVGLALAPQHGDAIEHIDADRAVIRYYAGPTMKNAKRIERRFLPTAATVPWWQSSALVGDVEWFTSETPQGEKHDRSRPPQHHE